jgi:hypothetical protein
VQERTERVQERTERVQERAKRVQERTKRVQERNERVITENQDIKKQIFFSPSYLVIRSFKVRIQKEKKLIYHHQNMTINSLQS